MAESLRSLRMDPTLKGNLLVKAIIKAPRYLNPIRAAADVHKYAARMNPNLQHLSVRQRRKMETEIVKREYD